MNTERATVSLPADVMQAAQQAATDADVPFSSVVNEALRAWLRGQLVDAWLADYDREHGPTDEDDLKELAAEVGLTYVAPTTTNAA
jgi:hypothetical protein